MSRLANGTPGSKANIILIRNSAADRITALAAFLTGKIMFKFA
jgi:hypothetical protein